MTENLSEVYEFENNGTPIKIVMYSGIRNKLIKCCSKNGGSVESLLEDGDVQEEALRILLAEYDSKGNVVKMKAEPFSLPLSVTEDLVVWGFDHCVNFITNSTIRMTKIVEAKKDEIKTASKATQIG